jgi:hypothetical protein
LDLVSGKIDDGERDQQSNDEADDDPNWTHPMSLKSASPRSAQPRRRETLQGGQEACKRPPIDLTPGWWRQSPETGWKRAAAGPREKARPDMLDTTFAVDVLPAKNFCKIALKKHRLTELCNFGRS